LTRGADAIYTEIKSTLSPATGAGARGGSITLLLPVPQRAKQIEFKIPGRFDVSPNAAGRPWPSTFWTDTSDNPCHPAALPV
ncbi:MAG: hypothetical protein AAFO75_11190, partial [Pseudomonadota bacterium]